MFSSVGHVDTYKVEVFRKVLLSNTDEVVFTQVYSEDILDLVGLLESGMLSYILGGYIFSGIVSICGNYEGVEFLFELDKCMYEVLVLCVPSLLSIPIQDGNTGEVLKLDFSV